MAQLGVIVYIAIIVVIIAGLWKAFIKAGEEGWKAIIPIWNYLIILKIAGRPWWWILLLLIPLVNIVVGIVVALDVAKAYGRGVGFGIGLVFLSPIFWCILGFGSATYSGPAAKAA
ncbi:MAG: DUF5684 domain-containing protein [Thermoleophilia bacterium]